MAAPLPCGRLQRWLLLIAAAIVLLVVVGTAWNAAHARQPVVPAGYSFPALTGRVVDEANMLSPADEAALTDQSTALEHRTGHQFVVATVAGLGGHRIEDYSLRLANHWGIGRKHIDDGVVLLVAPIERKVRIEVGAGLEKIVTDTEAARIIEIEMLPLFRKGDMAAGIRHGAAAIVADLSETQS